MSKLTRKSSLFLSINFIYLTNIHIAAQTQTVIEAQTCSSTTAYTPNTNFQTNVQTVIANLPTTNSGYGFFNTSTGQGSDEVSAMALCRGDFSSTQCDTCVENSIVKLRQHCQSTDPKYQDAIGYYNDCMVRYWHIQISVDPVSQNSTKTVTDAADFDTDVLKLMGDLTNKAAGGGPLRKYAADKITRANSSNIYGVAQCTPDLSEQQCSECLTDAASRIAGCCSGKAWVRVSSPSCYVRYDIQQFYSDAVALPPQPSPPPEPSSPPPPPTSPPPEPSSRSRPPSSPQQPSPPPPTPTGKKDKGASSIIIALTVAFVIIIAIVGTFIIWRKKRKPKACVPEINNSDEHGFLDSEEARPTMPLVVDTNSTSLICLEEPSQPEIMEYEFGLVRAATNHFSDDNKIGQGRFGSVYKGKLTDGRLIVVKRLSSDSRQVDPEFRSKAELFSKLKHENLARLLGLSTEGEERLLIYEFLPNATLEEFLLDPNKITRLDWGTSYKIIEGVARGLLYLHDDSHQTIIHCDLNASNVLLDTNMDPKITAFSTKQLFADDETQGNIITIAGTVGYMPPEYARQGHRPISVKLDVFSFGVLVLEIIKGKMCQTFRNGDGANLLSSAWKSWQEKTTLEMIDSRLLKGSNLFSEISKNIHIALLCVQESEEARPTMSLVLDMLKSTSPIPLHPSQPGFYDQMGTFMPSQKLAEAA